MGGFEGVDVHVISGGETLKLYHDPDTELNQGPRTRQQYVEAITGATFKVKVTISKQFQLFNLRPDDAVRASINYDGQKLDWFRDFQVQELRQVWRSGQAQEHNFTAFRSLCDQTQQWQEGETSFGALDTSDAAGAGLSVDDVKDLGRIQVNVRRIIRTKRSIALNRDTRPVQPVTEVSEKILKGKAIGNTVRVCNYIPSTAPPPITHRWRDIEGAGGLPLIFTIFYRSKHTLQMLGCIPRTPTPQPETAVINAKVDGHEARVRALRAELALLEGSANIKDEGSGARKRVKRELEDTENEAPRKRSRNLGTIETVDLTDD